MGCRRTVPVFSAGELLYGYGTPANVNPSGWLYFLDMPSRQRTGLIPKIEQGPP